MRTFGRVLAVAAGAIASVAGGVALPARPAHAALIWDGNAARGAPSIVFGLDNCSSPGSIGTATDTVRGQVWRFSKPAGDSGCEAHGFKADGKMYQFANNGTYYLGWASRLSSTVDNDATFQWRSYGNHTQDAPVALKVVGGRLTLLNRQPGPRDFQPWAAPVSAGDWNHVVLGIHTSDALTGGWVELYLNGVPQRFSNGSTRWPCRTWDSYNDPKWGVDGAQRNAVTNDVDDLRVGTTYADVALGSARPLAADASPTAVAPAVDVTAPPPATPSTVDSQPATAAPPKATTHGPVTVTPRRGSGPFRFGWAILAAAGAAGLAVSLLLRLRRPRRPPPRHARP